ncbi:LysR family transcriptional regulator [Tropicimonas isoalkanivorans]|uniref:DNA-binding transcriptional regulator, LysR family n=1 Tax=Tropicimonas isoalkanivorans TaxID=441112 RepID=A0A1I1JKX5_9RHOB|nr:LysR family transcriptional regulator [Tropicimonas isoalkanivorans]SFC49136.1 DNA-binding transcriptional regulator, LysR family [Tropicimonas isoalkanivorans]
MILRQTDSAGRVTLWGIEVFLAMAEEGSVSAAARRLGASPSGVSQQLTNLEAALGRQLIDRTRRPARLTPAGNMFRRRAQRIWNEAMQARAELLSGDLSGMTDLRLGMIEDFEADVTPRLLSDIAGTLTHCKFLLETGPSHRLLDQLESDALDVVVAAEIEGAAEWMQVHPLLEEPYVAAAPRGAGAQGLDGLQELPLIQYTQRHLMGRQIAAHLAHHRVALSHRFELDSYHAIMAMVASGAGWTILTPLGYLRAGRFREEVDVLPLPMAPLSRRIHLTTRAEALQEMPGLIVDRLKPLLQEMIVEPAFAHLPWLAGELRVL